MIKSALQSSLTNDIKYRSMSAGAVPSSEYLIQTYEVGATSLPLITFDNLAQWSGVYKHLQLVYIGRGTTTQGAPVLRFNADTNYLNYANHILQGNGSSVTSASLQSTFRQGMQISSIAPSGDPANAFGGGVVDILDPFETTKNTTIRSLGGTSSIVQFFSGVWLNTAAVSSITLSFFGESGGYATGSRFSLYGVTA